MNLLDGPIAAPEGMLARINAEYRRDEQGVVAELQRTISIAPELRARAAGRARVMIERMRERVRRSAALDTLLAEYDLTSREGLALMCLAEALLRVPDARTADRLIHERLQQGRWRQHVGASHAAVVNLSALALAIGAQLAAHDDRAADSALAALVAKVSGPMLRVIVRRALRTVSHQFVAGETIEAALVRGAGSAYLFSYDMLGEAALSEADAERYFASYRAAISAIDAASEASELDARPGISVKLSALHPRYEISQRARVLGELGARLRALAVHAARANVGLTVDAEEAARLELSLEVFERAALAPELGDWSGFGLVVQAYSKRALPVLDWVLELARRTGRRLQVRLAKGGYWDTEIKLAQVQGLDGYPVFTRKVSTDASYRACVGRLLAVRDWIYPMFATHNALTVATILELAGDADGYEFQRLYGMGAPLYDQLLGPRSRERSGVRCRMYAPVGIHDDLLPYLVRRLIENGATTSFVSQLVDGSVGIDALVDDPLERLAQVEHFPHPRIPLPRDLFAPTRSNSMAPDLTDREVLAKLAHEMRAALDETWEATPIIGGRAARGPASEVFDPADRRRVVGHVIEAGEAEIDAALALAGNAYQRWNDTPVGERAACLERAADLLELRMPRFMAMLVREAGKTVPDTVAELREAIDFLRYYAAQARATLAGPIEMPGPTGEQNELSYHGRGTFVCISPWNFPAAIFTGQVVAALVAGNCVVAKPAEQTALVGAAMVRLLHEAGVPVEVLHLLPGTGERVGAALCADPGVAGVAFTGSCETAVLINRALAAREGAIPRLIAETGGQNALIADSSALPEQVVRDAIRSAFLTSGQRCSALRLLFVQEEVADRIIEVLVGAMEQLVIGDPADLSTDLGPVIDEAAKAMLEDHVETLAAHGRLLHRCRLAAGTEHGTFFAPCAFEIARDALPRREVFGPVLHLLRYAAAALEQVVDLINETGYGLTLGLHSRLEATACTVRKRARVGNLYVNRDIIGAQVGVQPFGGERLSGTGPKAGGPNYLVRFATERSYSENTAAIGGNATLVTLTESPGG